MKNIIKFTLFKCAILILFTGNLFAQENENILLKEGNFFLGCNYWASNAGIQMWVNWNPEIIEEDFKKLSNAGIKVLRIFPTWNDFQPISAIRSANSKTVDYRFGENPLPDNYFGNAGVSEEMVKRMKMVLNLGEKYQIKFIVALLTGHMSGRIYIPPAFDGQMPLTDPEVIKWEVKYLNCLVNELKSYPSIIGWGLGNETNCLGAVTRAQAYNWSSLMANTIRSCDHTRPVLSDMHGLSPEGEWSILDQGEIADILTTHPYPLFSNYCGYEALNTIRPITHGAAESRYYADLSGKNVFIEEMGSLGPMVANNELTADFFRVASFSSWANNCHSTMWWCNSDFSNIPNAPYDWTSIENELGLFNIDGSPKPIVTEIEKINRFLSNFPYPELPKVKTDAVCILTKGQDNWAVAQSSFILSKQAGLNIEYQYFSQPLKESEVYLLPSVDGFNFISKSRLESLMKKIKAGAVLYISMNDAYFTGFEKITGLRVVAREGKKNIMNFIYHDTPMSLNSKARFILKNTSADVLAKDQTGNPVFTKFKFGKGFVYLLTAPLELSLANNSQGFKMNATPFWKIYQKIGENSIQNHILKKNRSFVGITEHYIEGNKCIAIIINYSTKQINDIIEVKSNWRLKKVYYGKASMNDNKLQAGINKNDALVIELIKIE